ncbi:TonB-dependent receptor plug domain-containing protein [Brevundimonas vesicularis]|uniref:Outer membrane beta-barrel protein n=1 Tax=Brevundimonas vesicularis TaxID=41276 RepID=A0A1Z3U6H1_BREVE|nr:TonB-dependent receptor [Brevundimonas vesicularis]ASE38887.1 TonB-dependent receptor [Brevundimonas vesicularis]MDX2335840.1 outer membrane beta-barrel protein [Brevundimonas vesicularis]
MTKTLLLASTALLFTAGAAFAADASNADKPQVAEAPVPTGPTNQAPLADASQRGVLVFTPDFFAAQRPNTALDMVNRVPGFSIDNGSGARGFEGAVGNVLINNNRPASKNDSGSNVLGRTLANQVERIELIRGGAPGIDMQGYSVVVNVILKTTDSRQSILTWNAMLFEGGHDIYGGSYQFTQNKGDRSWGVTLSDGMGSSDSNGVGRSIRRNAAGDVIRDERFENDGWGGGQSIRGNYTGPVFGGKLEGTARYGLNDYQNWTELSSPTSLRRSDYAEDGDSGELGLTWTRTLNPRWTLETRLIHEFSSFDSVSGSNETLNGTAAPEQQFKSDGDSSESILRALVRHERSPALTIEAGAEIAYNMLDVNQTFTIGGVGVPLPSASVKVEETRGEAFSKATWRINPKLTLEGGVRLEASTITQSGDADQEKSFFFAKPRLLATWTPMADNQLRFRFERELGQLDFGDFAASAELSDGTVFGGNVDLEPEQRWISELSYERRFWGEGVVSIGYRHDRIIDVIDRLPLPGGLSATGNIGNGTLDQLSLNVVVPLDKVGISGARFTFRNDWNKSSVTDPTTGEDRRISGVRPSQANVGFQQDITSWKTQWGINWLPRLGQATYDPDQTFAWRGADYLEAFVEYKPSPTLSLRAQLNLWDDFTQQRTVYATRNPRTVAFVEERSIDPRTFVSLRVRKTF